VNPIARRTAVLLFPALCFAGSQQLGQKLTLKDAMPVATVLSKPRPLLGKIVQVKGKIEEECQGAICWVSLSDEAGHSLRLDEIGAIAYPKEAVGKLAIVEGKLERRRDNRGKASYRIEGTGAIIFDN
jgi:hypothetical protein